MLVAVAVVAVLLAGTAVYAVSNDTGPVDVLSSEDRADVVDLGSGEVVDQVLLGRRPAGVAAGAGALWTTNPGDGSVSRLDPGSRQVLTTIPVGGEPSGVVVAGGSVWVTDQSGRSVRQISPDVDRVVATVTVGNQPTGIAAGPSGVWVANTAETAR